VKVCACEFLAKPNTRKAKPRKRVGRRRMILILPSTNRTDRFTHILQPFIYAPYLVSRRSDIDTIGFRILHQERVRTQHEFSPIVTPAVTVAPNPIHAPGSIMIGAHIRGKHCERKLDLLHSACVIKETRPARTAPSAITISFARSKKTQSPI